LAIAFHGCCTFLDDVVQIECNTDGQGYDADGQRDNLFDDHEDNHRQEIAAKY
jgi:hypothetical protein